MDSVALLMTMKGKQAGEHGAKGTGWLTQAESQPTAAANRGDREISGSFPGSPQTAIRLNPQNPAR
jgi:hypothetical protein